MARSAFRPGLVLPRPHGDSPVPLDGVVRTEGLELMHEFAQATIGGDERTESLGLFGGDVRCDLATVTSM